MKKKIKKILVIIYFQAPTNLRAITVSKKTHLIRFYKGTEGFANSW